MKRLILFIATILLSASFNMKADGHSWITTRKCLGINNKTFIEKLDSIVSMTRFTPETPIFEFLDEPGKYEDYPPNLLSITKYLQVEIFDSMPQYPRFDGSRQEDVDIQQTNEFYILITGWNIVYGKYYLYHNKHHYFFDVIIKPSFYRTRKTAEFKEKLNLDLIPFPKWIIKYSDGNMQLLDFYIHADFE